jgi:hypothetical protein
LKKLWDFQIGLGISKNYKMFVRIRDIAVGCAEKSGGWGRLGGDKCLKIIGFYTV